MRALRTLAIVFACLVYAAVFGELFLRSFKPQPLVPRYVTGGPDGVRANIPGIRFRQWTPEVDVTVEYNDAGMRDARPAPPPAKPVGECRVALLGDSYLVGFESDWRDSFPHRLEEALTRAGTRARVLDFAVSGFGTAEDLVVLQNRAARWQPDVVLMTWHASDPADNVRSGLFRVTQDGRLEPTGATFLPGVEIGDRLLKVPGYRWLIENSHLYSAVRERAGVFTKGLLAQLRGQAAVDEGGEAFVEGFGAPEIPVDALLPPRGPGQGNALLDLRLIEAVRDESAAAGARFLLFDVPFMIDRTHFRSPMALFLGNLPGIDAVSPMPAFEAAARPDLKLYWEQGHLHWTPAGNALAARVAADAMLARGWLAGCGGPAAR